MDEERSFFILAYGAVALSGGVMGILTGLGLGWIAWGQGGVFY